MVSVGEVYEDLAFADVQRLDKCTPDTRKMLPELDRQRPQYQHKTLLGKLQPAAAYLGLVGCVVILAFVSAAWWDDRATFAKVAIGYGPVRKQSFIIP